MSYNDEIKVITKVSIKNSEEIYLETLSQEEAYKVRHYGLNLHMLSVVILISILVQLIQIKKVLQK